MYMYVCVCMYICICVCMYVYKCMYVCVCICMCMYVCIYVCMYAYICICMCIYVFVYICTIYSVYMSNSSYFLYCPAFQSRPCCCTLSWYSWTDMAFPAIVLPVYLLVPHSRHSVIPTSWTYKFVVSGMDTATWLAGAPPGWSWPVLRPRTHVRHSSRPVSDARTQRPVPSHQFNIRIAQDGPEDEWKTVLQPRTLPDGTVLSRLIASRPAVCDGLNTPELYSLPFKVSV